MSTRFHDLRVDCRSQFSGEFFGIRSTSSGTEKFHLHEMAFSKLVIEFVGNCFDSSFADPQGYVEVVGSFSEVVFGHGPRFGLRPFKWPDIDLRIRTLPHT